jgi:transglutaminase-like putative cysteine protease
MLYEITHTSVYSYRDPVSVSFHVLRLNPRQLPQQHCLGHKLHIEPAPATLAAHDDYFGNRVSYVSVQGAHRKLSVKSSSKVEITRTPRPAPEETPAWETVREFCRGSQIGTCLDASEFLFDSPFIKPHEAFADYAAESFPSARPMLASVLDLSRRIHHDFKFDPKATTIATPLEEVLRNRRGVCQDFAHLQIACLRSIGLPARYVSGYLETDPPANKPRLIGADASHAWVSFFCSGIGWIDVDPTNNLLPDSRHVTLAWGRDYSDVSPIHGVLLGGARHTLHVSVDVGPT